MSINKKRNSVTIVIPNWNGAALLRKNLPAVIRAKSLLANNIAEIIVVDDGSGDLSPLILQKEFSEVNSILLPKNLGFSKAVNEGVRHVKTNLFCLLNTDVVPEENFLTNIQQIFIDASVFAVGLHEKGVGAAKGEFNKGFLSHKSKPETDTVELSLWASGGSAIFRKSIWDSLGGFDEKLYSPFYWEDVDIGYRAWKRGHKILWSPDARVIHRHESVINNKNFSKRKLDLIKERNELLFIWKNILDWEFARKHIWYLIRRTLQTPGYLRVISMALLKINLILKRRAQEKKESLISDKQVFSYFYE